MREVLVSLPTGAGVARADDGLVLVSDDVATVRGFVIPVGDQFHPAQLVSVDGQTAVVGGLLPDDALTAEVLDGRGVRLRAVVGGGAYVALVERPDVTGEPIVCCRDADGRPVRRPRAAGSAATRVLDARDPCPACGSHEFEEYRPFEAWGGGEIGEDGKTIPPLLVGCRVCGHEERQAIVIRAPDPPAAQPKLSQKELYARANAMRREHMWRAVADGIQRQGFPVYAAVGWGLQISECGTEDDGRLTYVSVSHFPAGDRDPAAPVRPDLTVTVKRDDPQNAGPLSEARHALRRWTRPRHDPNHGTGASSAAVTLQHRADSRRAHELAVRAKQSTEPISIDGQPTRALMLTTQAGPWAAVASHDNLTIITASSGLDPNAIKVARIPDPVDMFKPHVDGV